MKRSFSSTITGSSIAAASDQVAAAHLAANDVTLPLEECLDRRIKRRLDARIRRRKPVCFGNGRIHRVCEIARFYRRCQGSRFEPRRLCPLSDSVRFPVCCAAAGIRQATRTKRPP